MKMITILKFVKLVIQRKIVPNPDLDLIFNKMKICGDLEKLHKSTSKKYPFAAILFKPACVVVICVKTF